MRIRNVGALLLVTTSSIAAQTANTGSSATSFRGATTTTDEPPTEAATTTTTGVTETTSQLSNDALCLSETTDLVEDDLLEEEWTKIRQAIESDVRASLFTFCDLSEPACRADAADYDDDYIAACEAAKGQVVTKSFTAECGGNIGFFPVPDGLTFTVLNWPFCVSLVCNVDDLPIEVEKLVDAVAVSIVDEIEIGGSVTCNVLPDSSTIEEPTTSASALDSTTQDSANVGGADAPQSTTLNLRASTSSIALTTATSETGDAVISTSTTVASETASTSSNAVASSSTATEAPTEPVSKTSEATTPTTTSQQSDDDAKCLAETTGLVDDDVLDAEWTKIRETIEADVRADLFIYCDLSEPACQVDAAEYDDDFNAACTAANGKVVTKSVSAGCSGRVGFFPVPEGLIFTVLNWPFCVGPSCNVDDLPSGVEELIDDTAMSVVDDIEIGGSVTCEILPQPTTTTELPTTTTEETEATQGATGSSLRASTTTVVETSTTI